jgi:hypothetical protein
MTGTSCHRLLRTILNWLPVSNSERPADSRALATKLMLDLMTLLLP